MRLVRKLAGLGPLIEKMISDSGYHTQDMAISLPDGVTVLMDDCSDQKFDENGNVVYFDPKGRPWWKGAVETGKIYFAPANFSGTNKTAEFELGIPIYIDGKLFGTERMVRALNEKADADPEELLTHVKKRVDEFVSDAPQFDDITMLGIKWNVFLT